MKTYHKFNPLQFCRCVAGRGLSVGLMLMSAFWLTWTVAHAQSGSPDPELLPQPEVVQPAAPEAPIVREGTPQPRRGTPAPDAPNGRPWIELAPQWPAMPGVASLPDERIGPAGPAAPLAGTLIVNSTADTSLVDSVLTCARPFWSPTARLQVRLRLRSRARCLGVYLRLQEVFTTSLAAAARVSRITSSLRLRWGSGRSSR